MPKNTADLNALTKLVRPPPRPLRNKDEENWTRLLTDIRFKFPIEFLQYGRLFGTGEIDAEGYGLMIANPLDPAYPKWIRRISEAMRTRGDGPERRQTRFYPEDSGVVPFASDWSGDYLFLSSAGRSSRVVSCPSGDPDELVFYPLGLAGFLVSLFSADLKPEYFPNKELRKRKVVFRKRPWMR